MGRLWHSLILSRYHPLFANVPVESAVKDRQAEYYEVLGRCDQAGKSTEFIEFALMATLEAIGEVTGASASKMTASGRIEVAREHFGTGSFSRKDYIARFPSLSPTTASRDLQAAVEAKLLTRSGDKATTRYKFPAKVKPKQ